MKRSLNFRGKAGSHLTTANLADLMRRYVPEPKREAEVPVQVGALLEFPLHRLSVVATEFVRDAAFPDAVAQVIVESGTSDLLGHPAPTNGPCAEGDRISGQGQHRYRRQEIERTMAA